MALRNNPIPLVFPFGGVRESLPYAGEPRIAAVRPDHLQNMRPYDALESRKRGGQRPGFTKASSQQLGSGGIQLLHQFVDTADFTDAATIGAKFTEPASGITDVGGAFFSPDGSLVAIFGRSTTGGDDVLQLYSFDLATGYGSQIDALTSDEVETAFGYSGSNPSVARIAWSPDSAYLAVAVQGSGKNGGLGVYPISASTGFGTLITPSSAPSYRVVGVQWSADGNAIAYSQSDFTSNHEIGAYAWTGSAFGSALTGQSIGGAPAADRGFALTPNLTSNDFGVVAVQLAPWIEAYPFSSSTGFGTKFSNPGTGLSAPPHEIDIRVGGTAVAFGVTSTTTGYVYAFTPGSGWGSQSTQVTGLTDCRNAKFSRAGNYLIFSGSASAPQFEIYPWDGSIGTKIADPTDLPGAGTAYEMDWFPGTGADDTGRDTVFSVFINGSGNGACAWRFTAPITRAAPRKSRIAAVAGGTVYVSNKEFDVFSAAINGGSALSSSAVVLAANNLQRMFFVDGTSDYRYLDFADDTVKSWYDAMTAGQLPVGVSGSVYAIDAVNTGLKQFTVSEDLTALLSAGDYIEVSGSTGNDGIYRVDSVSGTTDIVVEEAVPDATADGTLGKADVGATMIAAYGNGIILAGVSTDPQNWYLLRRGDPFNADYSPSTPDGLEAVAGNNADAGKVGDIITALCPWSDDYLVFGCTNSLWLMSGDPAAGGRIDNISYRVGIVGPRAWAWDRFGGLYFMAEDGLYHMPGVGAKPKRVSEERLDRTFADIDVTTVRTILTYDHRRLGLNILIESLSEPTTAQTQYFYDERTGEFFPEKYPTTIGPSTAAVIASDDPDLSDIYLGGWDGYIRRYSDTARDDDGTAIDAFVKFPILHPNLPQGQFQLNTLQISLGEAGDGCSLDYFIGDTPEEAAKSTTSQFTTTLVAGRNLPIVRRQRANALILRLRNNTAGESFGYEAGTAMIAGVGRQRKGV